MRRVVIFTVPGLALAAAVAFSSALGLASEAVLLAFEAPVSATSDASPALVAASSPQGGGAPPRADPPPAAHSPSPPGSLSSGSAYVGAATCAQCHADLHARWMGGRHSKMVQPATTTSVKGDFGRRAITLRGRRYGLRAESGAFYVTESYLQEQARERRIELTLGNRRIQHYLARLEDGRIVVLPPTWDIERREWFHNMEIVDPEESSGRAVQVWSTTCFGCHVSGQEKVRDPSSGVVTSRWTDFGTSCERCHGPGAAHVERYRRGGTGPGGAQIVRPTRLPARESSMVCAQCHSLRDVTAAGFAAGADYFDYYLPVLEYAQKRNADPAYWGDGRPRRFSNDAAGLWQSQCFLRGDASCVTCHVDPHEPDVDRNPKLEQSGLCIRCHEAVGRDVAAHTRHDPAGPGAACVSCHMPKTVVGVKARMRDHTIGVPVPENTVRFGVPNACNECHRDRNAEWARRVVETWQPQSARRGRLVRRADVFARAQAREVSAVADLVALAEDREEGPLARANALGHLRRFSADPRTGPALQRGLRAEEPLLRAVAALGFVEVTPSDEGRAALVRSLADPRRTVRVGAALALAAHGVARLEGADGEALREAQHEYVDRAALYPDDPGTLLEVGKFHLAVESWDRAEPALRAAFLLEPDRPTLRYFLGLALLRERRVEEGRLMLSQVPEGDTFHGTARQLLARLDARP